MYVENSEEKSQTNQTIVTGFVKLKTNIYKILKKSYSLSLSVLACKRSHQDASGRLI